MKQIAGSLFLFAILVALDQVTKYLFGMAGHGEWNQGIIFGQFSHIGPEIRIFLLSSFGAFCFSIYVALLFFIPRKVSRLSWFLSFLLGGIIGNVIDRAIHGQTMDFIPLGRLAVTFNLADLFQWVGAVGIIYYTWFQSEKIFRSQSNRSSILVLPKEQLRFAFKLSLLTITTSFLMGLVSLSFVKMALNSLPSSEVADRLLLIYAGCYSLVTLTVTALMFVFGLYLSHRTAGPIHAFSMFVDDLTQGKIREFRLRDRDHYCQLEHIARKLQHTIHPPSKKKDQGAA